VQAHLGAPEGWGPADKGSKLAAELDRQLLSKVLPRIRGPRGTAEPVLREVLVLAIAGLDAAARAECRGKLWNEAAVEPGPTDAQLTDAAFPGAARKAWSMLVRLDGVGFTSFF
jgi:hypothetical protein